MASIRIASNAAGHKRKSQISRLSRIVAGVGGVSSSVLGNMSFSIMCTFLMMPNSLPQQFRSIFHPSPCSPWQHNVHDAQYHVKQEGESDERWRSDECEQLIDHQELSLIHISEPT